MNKCDSVWFGAAGSGGARFYWKDHGVRPGLLRCGAVWSGWVWHGLSNKTFYPGAARNGLVMQGEVWHGLARFYWKNLWNGLACKGPAWSGTVRHGLLRYDMGF